MMPLGSPPRLNSAVKTDLSKRRAPAFHASRTCTARSTTREQAWTRLDRLRLTLGYTATLDRGYAVVRGADGTVLTRKKDAKSHVTLEIEFADGTLRLGESGTTKASKTKATDDQGSLF